MVVFRKNNYIGIYAVQQKLKRANILKSNHIKSNLYFHYQVAVEVENKMTRTHFTSFTPPR